MVRETRHLWVGNLPENISEERIREHFKRYGPVQSVKVVSRGCDEGSCAAVAFVDICSAAKAHKADHRLEERLLKTTYYEPSLTALSATHYPSSGSALHRDSPGYAPSPSQTNSHLPHGARSPRFSTGVNEDHNSYDRSSHFYESRRDEGTGYNGPGGPGLPGGPVVQGGMRRAGYPSDRDADFGTGARGRVRSYPPRGHFLTNGRAEPGEYRWGGATQYRYHSDAYVEDKIRRGSQGVSPPPPLPRSAAPRNPRLAVPSNKHRLAPSRSGSESPSSSRSSRSSSSNSSSSSSRSSSSRSGSLGRSSRSNSRSPRRIGNPSQSLSVVPSLSPPGDKRPLAISVKNLPPWSSDNSLKDGLFHDYKKHGKVTMVRIFGSGSDRYAVVCFKKPEDAEKAFDASEDKQFFGVKIQVSPHEGLELDESEFRSYDIELDEYHPKATRTLFIGGLDKDVTAAELRKHFEAFGEIIEIDIKKQNSSTFAFCQYSDIRSVVQAVKKMDGEHLGGNRIKLGFGKSMPNRYIWVGGVSDGVTEAALCEHFSRFGPITQRNIDREKGHALIAYESERNASSAVTEMRGCLLGGKRLQIDFASRECQVAFYENLNKQEFSSPTDRAWDRREIDKFDRSRREGTFIARQLPSQRIQTFSSSRTRTRYEGFEEYSTTRNFDEFADNSFERDLHEYAGRQRYENGPTVPTPHGSAPTSSAPLTTAVTTVKHRAALSPGRKRDEKSPHSPRSLVREAESLSPLIRGYDDLDGRKSSRHRSTSDHDSFHSQSPPPSRGARNPSVSRMPSHSPSTPLATSPSREVTVVEDPRRRRTSDFKDLVVRVSDMRRPPPESPPVRHRTNHRIPQQQQQQESEPEETESFGSVGPAKPEPQDPRLVTRRGDEPFSSGDERSLDGADRPPSKKSKLSDTPLFEKHHLKRSADGFDYRSRDHSPNFRKPFEARKTHEGKITKREVNRVADDPLRSPQSDPRHRKASVCSDMEDTSSWRGREVSCSSVPADTDFLSDASPPGTPVRDEREDPPLESSSRRPSSTHSFSHQKEKAHSSPISLPLPKFAQQVRLHLSPRGACASPRGGGLLRSPTFNTGTNWTVPVNEVNHSAEEINSVLADTPVSPGPAAHDSPSDSEESPSVSPNNTAGDLYERIKALEEKYEKWTGSSRSFGKNMSLCRTASGSSTSATLPTAAVTATGSTSKGSSCATTLISSRKKRILDLEELKCQEPSDIVKSLLSKRSVFDEDSERLENISDKYEPRPFSSMPRSKSYSSFISSVSYSPSSSSVNSSSICSSVPQTTTPSSATITYTTIPIPSATPLNSLPGIRRPSATTTVSSPQTTRPSFNSSVSSSGPSTTTPTSSGRSNPSTRSTSAPIEVVKASSASSSGSGSASHPQTSAAATIVSSTSVSSATQSRRSSVGTPSGTSTGVFASNDAKMDVSSPHGKICDTIVTVSADTKVTCAVSVIQTSCSSKVSSVHSTQTITSSSSVSSAHHVSTGESTSKSRPLSEDRNRTGPEEILSPKASVGCEKKVLIEKEQVQNSTAAEGAVKEVATSDTPKSKIKDNFNNCSLKPDSFHPKIKSETCEMVDAIRTESAAPIQKRRLSSTEESSHMTERRTSKGSKEALKTESRSAEPESKKLKLEMEEEKENKLVKSGRDREGHKRERTKSGRKEEPREVLEDKSASHSSSQLIPVTPQDAVKTIPFTATSETVELKQELKHVELKQELKHHKKEERQEVKEKPDSHKMMEIKEEKVKESEKEKRKDKYEDKDKMLSTEGKHTPKSERHRTNERKAEKVEDKKEIKVELREEKVDEKEEKKKEVRDETKIEKKEEKEEKPKEYEKRRHSEESKAKDERKERGKDKRDREKLRDKERHRSSAGHSERDGEKEKVRDRDKEKIRLSERGKEKDKQRHSKQNAKSEERLSKHHSEKKERRETVASLSSPSEHSSSNSFCERSLKKTQTKHSKHNFSILHDDDMESTPVTSGHKLSQNPSKGKETVDKQEADYNFQERLLKETTRKKHDSGRSEDKSKSSHSSRKMPSLFSKGKVASPHEEDERADRIDSEELSSEEENKPKNQLVQPAKRTKQRATSSSSGSRRGRPKNKSILDTESETADSESDSEHKPKKPSYFDITIYDGNMYDKVKARRVKLDQKREEDPKQQEIKQKLLQQRSKRSKKPQTSSCNTIPSESEETDNDIPKKRSHARIRSSSEEDTFLRSRPNHLSSEESDSVSTQNKQEKKKKLAKDFKAKKSTSKTLHVSDITTDEDTAIHHPPRHMSGTESDSDPRSGKKELVKIESDSEASETGSRKPPRPALSASRGRLKEKEHKTNKSVEKTETRQPEEENDLTLLTEEMRHLKPKLRAAELNEVIGNKASVCEKRKHLSESSVKEKGRKEGRIKAIFGLMSDDSDSNAPPPNLPLTSTDLISATSYRKGSASSGASSGPLNMTPPSQPRIHSGVYESDIDDDFRPSTPDPASQKTDSFEPSSVDKNLHSDDLKAFVGHNMKDILQEGQISKEDILSPSWREVREQTVKEVVCEASRAASDSGKGSSSGVSTASSSSGSSAEELLLLEASSVAQFREEPEPQLEKGSSKEFLCTREPELKENIPRKDKKKKKKHKDKDSSRSHRQSSNKDSHNTHSHVIENKSLLIDESISHHYKFGSREDAIPCLLSKKEKSIRRCSTTDTATATNIPSDNSINDSISSLPSESPVRPVDDASSREPLDHYLEKTPEPKGSPPLDMPMIKPDEPDLEEPLKVESDSNVFDVRIEKKLDSSVDPESAVQSIADSSGHSPSQAMIEVIVEPPASPVPEGSAEEAVSKPSRSTISQEETLNAVAGLLACYNDYQEEASPSQTEEEPILQSEPSAPIEDPVEQSEEAQKAAQMLQSEIGVGRETEERDESWEEALPLNEATVDPPQCLPSPEPPTEQNHSPSKKEANTNPINLHEPEPDSPKQMDEINSSHESLKEPLQFPDSPSSVQSEPALQIDEDERLDPVDTNIPGQKSIKEVLSTPDRSSVWNTPESDIQETKPLTLIEDSDSSKILDDEKAEVVLVDHHSCIEPTKEEIESVEEIIECKDEETSKDLNITHSVQEREITEQKQPSVSESDGSLSHSDTRFEKPEFIPTSDVTPVPDLESLTKENTVCNSEPLVVSSNSLPTKPEVVELLSPNKVEEEVAPTLEEITPLSANDVTVEKSAVDTVIKTDCIEEIKQEDALPSSTVDIDTEKKSEPHEEVQLHEKEELDNSDEIKLIEESALTQTIPEATEVDELPKEDIPKEASAPKDENKFEEPERATITRGRARGRGRRGCRRVPENTSTPSSGNSLILTRSVSTRSSKSRGRGRNSRTTELGEEENQAPEASSPEKPRRSTRTKRARKHPDMVEHDETTNRRKRSARGGKTTADEASLKTNTSSDVYDFHDSDEDEVGVALSKKGKKDSGKPPTPSRSPAKASEEIEALGDSATTRKSRRLREKVDEDGVFSEEEHEGQTPPPPITRSRGRARKDAEGEDEQCGGTPRKSPRSRSKAGEGEHEGGRELVTLSNEPSTIGEVVIQKIDSPLGGSIPPLSNALPTLTSSLPTLSSTLPASMTVSPKTLIIPCTKPYNSNTIPSSHVTSMTVSAVPAVYSTGISSHPVKLSIVQSTGLRNICKGVTSQISATTASHSPSLLNVTSVPVPSQVSRDSLTQQPPHFSVTSTKELTSSPVKTGVSINCSPLPTSAFKAFPNGKKPDTLPTPLVDPVTGHLTPMKISDEGHYIPIGEQQHLAALSAKEKIGHQGKVLRAVLPSSITVTTITNSSPAIAVSLPNSTVSTVVSANRHPGLASLPKGVAVTPLPRGSEVSVELVSRTRPSILPASSSNILLTTQKGIPNFVTKTQIPLSSSHSPTNPLTSAVINSHVIPPQGTNSPNVVTITTPSKLFATTNTTIMTTNSAAVTRVSVLGGPVPQLKGPITPKLQTFPSNKVPGNSPSNLNVQSIILTSQSSPQHSGHRGEYTPQTILSTGPQQPTATAGTIGTVSVSRIPSTRSSAPPQTHEQQHSEYVTVGMGARYPDPTSRFREPPIVEVARLPGGSPVGAALSPVPRNHEPESAHIARTHYELHQADPNTHSRQGMRASSSVPLSHVPSSVATKGGLSHFFGEMHKKGPNTQPLSGVPPGVGVERYLASPPLHTPPSNQTPPTPPPAHNNTPRENLPINSMYHRNPYLVSDPRAVYGDKMPGLPQMPIDLKVIEKCHLADKSQQEDKERPGSGPIPLNEYSASRPPTVITPHPSSPRHLPSPHFDRCTDSPQATMMYSRRYAPHYETNIYQNRSGTPGLDHDPLPRSPAPLSYAPVPPGEAHHPPRVQIPGTQYTSQVSPQIPPHADNLQYLLQNYPIMWDGTLGLKNEQASVKMHFISGSMEVARGALPEGSTSHIRISQRMRLEQSQLEGVARKMQMKAEHCMLMALPYGRTPFDLMQQQKSLENGFIKYLGEDKKAAGIVNVHMPGSQQSAYVIHIFPPCDFANDSLVRLAPNLVQGLANTSRLLVVIATC